MDSFAIALVELLINAIKAYVFAGFLFSVIFLIFGIQRVDPDVKGLSLGFRLIIIPGLCVFWPLFALRWIRGRGKPTERNTHRQGAKLRTIE